MAITVNHKFVSAKGDGSDATLVRPSNWNASHDINMATSRIIGRLTAGPGLAEELPVTSYMIGLLNSADANALALLLGLPMTGDAMLTYTVVARTGWVFANDGSVGDVGSGATTAAANTVNLFTLFYNTYSDAVCPLQTSTGVSTTRAAQGAASTAFSSAKCRMVIPKTLGRALIVAGSGVGLTARTVGTTGGEETHTLTAAESVPHTHSFSSSLSSTSISGTPTGSTSTTISGSTGFQDANHYHNTDTGNTGSGGSYAAGYNLDHTHGGIPNDPGYVSGGFTYVGPGYSLAYVNWSATHNTGGSGILDHAHYTDVANTSSGIELGGAYSNGTHKHAQTGTFGGTCSVSTWTGVTVNGTAAGTTGGAQSGATPNFSNAAFNVMQPWTAWNVMIRL